MIPEAGEVSSEFDLIERWLGFFDTPKSGVRVGPGDDAAVLRAMRGRDVVATTDALVDGVHFDLSKTPPKTVGHKALAVNLSDLAAMGARPRWLLVSLALHDSTTGRWLDDVARGMAPLARKHGVSLVGGNVTRSAKVALHLTLLGEAAPDRVLRRTGARPGDGVWVSGELGEAALDLERGVQRKPQPRVNLGLELASRRVPSACIDVSDGLAADLAHLTEASRVGAHIQLALLPCSNRLRRAVSKRRDPWKLPVRGGEDYELLFTVPRTRERSVRTIEKRLGTRLTRVGEIVSEPGVLLLKPDGRSYHPRRGGWEHF